jgi:hypothetical protein
MQCCRRRRPGRRTWSSPEAALQLLRSATGGQGAFLTSDVENILQLLWCSSYNPQCGRGRSGGAAQQLEPTGERGGKGDRRSGWRASRSRRASDPPAHTEAPKHKSDAPPRLARPRAPAWRR